MAVQWSVGVRNTMLDAWETAIGLSARVRLLTGAPPATTATAESGVLIAAYLLASDWSAAAAAGAKSLSGTPLSIAAVAAGTLGYYRIVDNAGTTCHEQGTITASGGGGDMTVDNTSVANGQTVNITGYTKTAPGA